MSRPVVAAFDLDGTLTARDTLVPFLRRAVGAPQVAWAIARRAPVLVSAQLDRARRDAAKEALLVETIGGRAWTSLREVARDHAGAVPLRDDVVALLREHQRRGHTTVVVSASPSLYVDLLAERLGITVVVATELEVLDGIVTGRYAGSNCRDAEKLRRLEAWLGGRDVELHAYGNPPDDEPMLRRADVAVRV